MKITTYRYTDDMPSYAINKEGQFKYDILEKIEAGLVLKGHEVKAIKSGLINLKGSYVSHKKSEFFLINCHIAKYKHAGKLEGYNPESPRKLLLQKKEMKYLQGKLEEKGLTIVPLRVYSKRGILKVELGIARGKKKHDKRDVLKKRTIERDLSRQIKQQF